ncbi:hypothetical protein DMUE_3037 [Dictyocoela muelleri]|nr:hypothetical protein DMUE_3037 [Dictyocoela muelleri]
MNKEKILQNYKSDNNFKKYVKFLMILAYIPIEKVNDEFKKLKKYMNKENEYIKITEYFDQTFLQNKHNIGTKELNFWSVNKRMLIDVPTTTNTCESYHKYINSMIKKKNPSLGK